MKFTIKELCSFLGVEVPELLKKIDDTEVQAINARYTTLEKGDVFFDINFDCEDLTRIDSQKCPFIITDRDFDETSISIPVVRITDALDKYVALCKVFVDEYPDTVRIAVTGSTGKTSMKETIAAVLGNVASTDKSFSNQNNIYFLSKKLQKSMPANLRFYVQEACIKVYEDINLTEKLAIAYQPNFAVMNNIYDNHAEVYGNRETTFKIKSAIVEQMGENGVALLNMDDDILCNYHPRCKTVYYSIKNPNADLFADNINVSNEGTHFDLHWQGRVIKDVFCSMIGRPNIYNCMVAFAIGSMNGVDDELLVRSIRKMRLDYSLRQNHMKVGPYNLFIDCFNASPESIASDMLTMEDLSAEDGGRKIAVIGDVAELGEQAQLLHRNIGVTIGKSSLDRIFFYGEFSTQMYDGAVSVNPQIHAEPYTDYKALEQSIKDYIKPGDLILWKASRATHIEIPIDDLFGTDYYHIYPDDYDLEALIHPYPPINTNNPSHNYRANEPVGGLLNVKRFGKKFDYCNFKTGIKLARYNATHREVIIPDSVNGINIRSIGDRAFYKHNAVIVKMPDSILNIGTNAFLRCSNLRSVKLSSKVKFIDYSAFAICTALEKIEIPSDCLIIRRKAFYQCSNLNTVVINGMYTYLEEDVFLECGDVHVLCRAGSLAEKCAIEQGLSYCLLQDDGTYSDVIHPTLPEKGIEINEIFFQQNANKTRLNFKITIGNEKPDILWYEVDNKWAQYMNDDRIDAIVVSLFLFAIRGGYTKIKSDYPISEELKYQLTTHLIPQIVSFEGGSAKATSVQIDAPSTTKVYEKPFIANGTGFSRGVDSFATLYEYGKNSDAPENYKVNFLNVYNVGAFHGLDSGKRSRHFSRELFSEQVESTAKFAEEYGYYNLVVDSNLALFIRTHFNEEKFKMLRKFQSSATERNIGTTLLFQKLFSRFYYASGHTLKEFKMSLDESSALWEQYGVQFFSTENIRFYIANRDWTRMDKVERVAQLPESYDNLQVCLVQTGNCGLCMKCKRTLMNLDVLGDEVLDRFSNSFDVDTYKRENRKAFFNEIWVDNDTDNYANDILEAAIKRKADVIQEPPVSQADMHYVYRYKKSRFSVREYPTYLSKAICLMINDVDDLDMTVEGIHRGLWVKVRLSDGRIGYVDARNIRLSEFHQAHGMSLNAGNKLTLFIDKKYGLLPKFAPGGSNEQVSYSVDNNEVAYVNKMGWVCGKSEGTAVVTAVSETGLVAKCTVRVKKPALVKYAGKYSKARKVIGRILPGKIKAPMKKTLKKLFAGI